MIALADRWNDRARMRRVMVKTLQQARYQKIWEPHGSAFVPPLDNSHGFALVGIIRPEPLSAALDVAALLVAQSNPVSFTRERYFSFQMAINIRRIYPSLHVKDVKRNELFAAVGFPSSTPSPEGKKQKGKSEQELRAVAMCISCCVDEDSISHTRIINLLRPSDELVSFSQDECSEKRTSR